MRIAEYKAVDYESIISVRRWIDENGEPQSEEVTEQKPIMGMVYRDMTDDEIAELSEIEPPIIEPTPEERLEAVESALLDIIMGGGIND